MITGKSAISSTKKRNVSLMQVIIFHNKFWSRLLHYSKDNVKISTKTELCEIYFQIQWTGSYKVLI